MVGTTISHYKVIEKIGQGGMGTVYRAQDTNLSREVAIKVLPEQFTQDPQRLARFEREAKLLASLNHPNIAAIHSFEHADDVHFLVLELVPGETLAERVAKGPLPVEEALEVCRQIAEGVEAAHEKGVIHRDLKPANVKVTPEGKVKILDFGLAKAFEGEVPVADISQSPTLTEEMTRAGVILGTAAYMSPEQAKGKPVDKRADIFAFGCVLYELLTGKRAFEGETITETIAAVLKSEPDWEALPESTPWRIRDLLHRYVQKDPSDRLRDIGDARITIGEALKEPEASARVGPAGTAPAARWRVALPWGAALLMAVLAIGIARWGPSRLAPQPTSRFTITPTAPLADSDGRDLAISPDGRSIVYLSRSEGQAQLYLRVMDEFQARPLPGTEGADRSPFFSPDGDSVGFFAAGKLKRISPGGPVMTLCEASNFWGGSWGPEGLIVFAADVGLYRVPAAGGVAESLVVPDTNKGELLYSSPELLPGGQGVLFTVRMAGRTADTFSDFQISALSLDTGEQKTVIQGAREPRYLATGHLIYELTDFSGTLMAAPFDLEGLEVTGDPVPVLEGLRVRLFGLDYGISANGTLVYVPVGGSEELTLVWVDRQGRIQPLTEVERSYRSPRVSPDGRYLAVRIGALGSEDSQIWIYEIARGTLTLLTFERRNVAPVWTPDGRRVTFGSGGPGQGSLFWKPADGSGVAEQLLASDFPRAGSWAPDGKVLAFTEIPLGKPADIWLLQLESEWTSKPFLHAPFNEGGPAFSPDGRWLAYVSDESGQFEVYVRPFPGPGSKWPISIQGGVAPVWARDGRELFYRNGYKMMAVTVEAGSEFSAGRPEVIFEGRYVAANWYRPNYDISPDGQQFVMVRSTQEEVSPAKINVVLNWFEELKRLVPTP